MTGLLFRLLFVCGVSSVLLTGCSSNSVPTATVSGKVTYEGAPVTEGNVLFVPVGEGVASQVTIQADGTFQSDSTLVPGEYRVAVVPPTIIIPDTASSPGGETVKEMKNIPPKYRSPANSGLTFTVQEGNQTIDIQMTK